MRQIPTVELGRTGRTVTRIGLGLAALGRPGYINLGHGSDFDGRADHESMESHAQTVLTAALDRGITYFDAARSYGDGEGFLGRWLLSHDIDDREVTVSSKWGYRYVADWKIDADVHEVKEHTVAHLNSQLIESTARLGRYLNVYQIHSATIDSGVLDNQAVLDRLAELRSAGLAIGLSTSGPSQSETIRAACAIKRDGERLFDTVQSTWNLLEPSAGPALAEAHEAGMSVIIKEAVANGRLTSRDPQTVAPLNQAFPSVSPDAVAIAAVLTKPWVDVVLSGASTMDQLDSNLKAIEIDTTTLGDLSSLAEASAEYWSTRSSLDWN